MEEEIIKDIYRDYWRFMIEKNADKLRGIMSDNYYLLHMTGIRQTKEEFLNGLLDGTFNYYSAVHDQIEVRIDAGSAAMTGRSRVSAVVYGGRKHTWKLQGDFTLKKENGSWKLTSSKASTY